MNILQVYAPSDSMAKNYAKMLAECLGQHLGMRSATSLKEFRKLCAEQTPDIVHLHGEPPFSLPSGIRLVVTPHGHSVDNIEAYVFIARSQMEQSQLSNVGSRRITTIRNPLITRTITPEECATMTMLVYRRVMNSSVLQLMNEPSKKALRLILSAALYGDLRWLSLKDADKDLFQQLTSLDYQRIYIYSEHEGLFTQIQHGLNLLGIDAPPFQPVECYLPTGFKRPQPSSAMDVVSLISDIKAHGPSLLRLYELTKALHDVSLDEGRLLRQLDDRSLRPLFASTLQLASECMLLTEGFMPCQPADNRDTQQLRTRLVNRQNVMA